MFSEEFLERVKVSIFLSPFVLIIAFLKLGYPFNIGVYTLMFLLILIILFEIFRMYENSYQVKVPKIKKSLFIILMILYALFIILLPAPLSSGENFVSLIIGTFYLTLLIFAITISVQIVLLIVYSLNISKKEFIKDDLLFIVFVIYLGLSVGSLISIKDVDISNNTFFIPFILAVVWFGELGALIAGKTIGKIKLSFTASPNKTLEGTIAQIVFGILAAIFFKAILDLAEYKNELFLTTYLDAIIMSILISLSGFFGDLIESFLKRLFNSKDSSNILGPIGGFFDVFDGVLFASIIVYMYVIGMGNFLHTILQTIFTVFKVF